MNRTDRVLETMRAQPGRGWTSSEVSVSLNCAPAMARKVMLRLVGVGILAVDDGGLFRLADAPPPAPDPVEQVFGLLSPTREITPFGVADLYPELGLSEDEVLAHLVTLARAGRIDLWASLPRTQKEWDEYGR